jgi:hypothetical protein
METVSSEYFHGTNGDNILNIIEKGQLFPGKNQKIFLGRYSWESCMMHGPDRNRHASFVIKVRIVPADDVRRIFRETHGVCDAVEIQTDKPMPVEVLEMYVRRLVKDEPAKLDRFVGKTNIINFLGPALTHP